ncbi:TPA: ATP-binding protein [Escherichia coli]|nr:ATP-binding protein [Escherichia coli]
MSNIHHLERSLRKLRLTRVGAECHALEKRALAEGHTHQRIAGCISSYKGHLRTLLSTQ